jgi:hypothetical protein
MKKLFFLFVCSQSLFAQLKTPDAFLTKFGQHVTYLHEVEDYFEHLIKNSDRITKEDYGKTYQDRTMSAYYISTPNNIKNLEAIRKNHLSTIGLDSQKDASFDKISILWMSMTVHGNEIAGTESSLKIAYELLTNPTYQKMLENVVVILDPCANPDGYNRYATWLRDIAGSQLHPDTHDREHQEPWITGRQNHYVNDLNRDWAWQTQLETQNRIAFYQKWMPMVHADVHEMGYNEPYYFPPAADPFHEQVTAYQKEFHQKVGEITSTKFDKEGWLYYSAERFDLFYPSYGDTYPTYNGAIGMTYEQGGIGAGRAVKMRNGQILTIRDRLEHHATAMFALLELTAKENATLNQNFRAFFNNRQNIKGKYKAYVIKSNPRVKQLAELLDKNKIDYQWADEKKATKGTSFNTIKEVNLNIESNDLYISTNQPRAVLTQVLLEAEHKLTDSLTYDITAWSLPLAYGLDAYGLKMDIGVKSKKMVGKTFQKASNYYAYHMAWGDRMAAKTLAWLHRNGFLVRHSVTNTMVDGKSIKRGDIIVLKADQNDEKGKIFESIHEKLFNVNPEIQVLGSGFGKGKGDLGGENYPIIKAPKILVLGGRGVSSVDFGQVWYFFDQVIDYPHSKVEVEQLGNLDFSKFNTIIMPNGRMDLKDNLKKKIDTFIEQGGKVIAIGQSTSFFNGREGYTFKTVVNDEPDSKKDKFDELTIPTEKMERLWVSQTVNGAIIEHHLDESHPFCYGLGNKYFSLKDTSQFMPLIAGIQNLIYVPKSYTAYGFIGHDAKKKLPATLLLGLENKGNGSVIYMIDNPLFRNFWENGNILFSNALFF